MKSSKIILISLSLLLCATAKAQEPTPDEPQSIFSSAGYYDPIHPEYAGTLSSTYPYSEIMNLNGEYAIEIIFYGSTEGSFLYTLYIDSNSGHRAYVNLAGLHLLYIELQGPTQLSIEPAGTANCNWRIYKYYEI